MGKMDERDVRNSWQLSKIFATKLDNVRAVYIIRRVKFMVIYTDDE